MTISVTTWDQQSSCDLGDIPIIKSVSTNATSLSVIYNYLRGIEDKIWLDRATEEASSEMLSDVSDLISEAREAIQSARKQIPIKHKILNCFKVWPQMFK